MARYIWDPDYEMFVDAATYWTSKANMSKRSHLSSPSVVSDTMDPVKSMLDGRMYDSKARLRQTYRDGNVIEVGNDVPTKHPERKSSRDDVKAAVGRAFSQAGLGA